MKDLKVLKIGDIVEVYNRKWEERIFIKYGVHDSVICVHGCDNESFENGYNFGCSSWTNWRIKKEIEYLPFTFEDKNYLKGKWIEWQDLAKGKLIEMIIAIDLEGVYINEKHISFAKLYKEALFDNGAICGKIKGDKNE